MRAVSSMLYIAFTLVLAALAVALLSTRGHERLLGAVSSAVIVAAVIGLLVFRVAKGRESFLRAGLRGGRFRHWLTYGGPVVLFLGIQAALNAAFGLGKAPDLTKVIPPGLHVPKPLFIAGVGIQSIVEGSLVGLVLGFGEEYGWRGFLQGQLIRLGRRRGVFLVGLIWGAWHWPIIWMGYNYPGYPVAGTAMMTLLTVLLAFVFGYAMLKTGSIWLVAFMHALFDQTGNYIAFAIDKPTSPIFSFGIGIYGLAMLALVVLFLLRDPVWNEPVPAQAVIPPAAAPPA